MTSNLQRCDSDGRVERSLFLASSDLCLLDTFDFVLSAFDFLEGFATGLLLGEEFRLDQNRLGSELNPRAFRVSASRYYYLISNETELATHKTTIASRSFPKEMTP